MNKLARPHPFSWQPGRTASLVLLLLLALMTLLMACQEEGPARCDEGGVLFGDDFRAERDCGWALYDQAGAEAEITDEVLRITTGQPGQIWWTNPGRAFDDVIVSANMAHVSGPEDNAYGVICRYQSPENFYVFLVSSDGYYAIGKYQSGNSQITYLNEGGQYQESEAINPGHSANTIRASCVGNELAMEVNGVPLESVNDPTFVTGDVGLAASSFQPGTLVVEFDNVRVLQP